LSGLAALTVLVVAIVGAIVAIFRYTNSAFILGVLPVAAAIIVAAIQYRQAKDKETDARLFSEKQAAYTNLIGLIMGLLHEKAVEATSEGQPALVAKLQSIRTQLVIWGSSLTLLTFDKMGSLATDASGIPVAATKWMAELLGAIRKDLGHKDPPGAAMEMALGILKEPDRSIVRAAIMKSGK
jgi:hypothetical protein